MIDKLAEDLRADEGERLKVYKCPAGFNTIGVGRNLDTNPLSGAEVEFLGCTTAELLAGREITQEQSAFLLANDIDRVCASLDRELPWWKSRLSDVQRGMANMCFQMGLGGLLKFKRMLACLQAGDYVGARREALDSEWARQTPKRAERVTALFYDGKGHPFS